MSPQETNIKQRITKKSDIFRLENNSTNSLSYSSSSESSSENTTSTHSSNTVLRPSVTIHRRTDINKQRRKKGQLNDEWQLLFQNAIRQQTIQQTVTHQPDGQSHPIQTTIFNPNSFQADNLPFSDEINIFSEVEGFLFHNINGIKDEANWTQINLTMAELNITCFGLVEINTTLRGLAFSKWNDITRKTFRHSKCSSSESDIKFDNGYKPGGTMTTVVGKWQARISDKGSDPTGLGRWNYLKISSNRQNLMVVTAYRPCKTKGPTTNWTQ
jgi:hypothetical protein